MDSIVALYKFKMGSSEWMKKYVNDPTYQHTTLRVPSTATVRVVIRFVNNKNMSYETAVLTSEGKSAVSLSTFHIDEFLAMVI